MLNIIVEHKFLFLIIFIAVLINAGCLIWMIIKERRYDKAEIEEIVNELMDAKPREDKVLPIKQEDIENTNLESIYMPLEEKEEIVIIEDVPKIEPKKETIKIDIKDDKADISSMLNLMKRDLAEKKSEDAVADFEAEQEETSIISYQELINSMKSKKDTRKTEEVRIEVEDINEVPVIEIEENNDIPVIDIEENNVKPIKKMIEDKSDFSGEKVIRKKFKTTEFISPVYGKMENTGEYPIIRENKHELKEKKEIKYRSKYSLEETLDLSPLNDEIKKNDEFLSALKDFRKNLE